MTREELKRQSEESVYPPLGIFYVPSRKKVKPRNRLPYLPKLLKEHQDQVQMESQISSYVDNIQAEEGDKALPILHNFQTNKNKMRN